MTGVLKGRDTEKDTQGEGHAAREAKVEVTLPRPKQGYQQPPKLGEAGRSPPLELPRECAPVGTLILDLRPPDL